MGPGVTLVAVLSHVYNFHAAKFVKNEMKLSIRASDFYDKFNFHPVHFAKSIFLSYSLV